MTIPATVNLVSDNVIESLSRGEIVDVVGGVDVFRRRGSRASKSELGFVSGLRQMAHRVR